MLSSEINTNGHRHVISPGRHHLPSSSLLAKFTHSLRYASYMYCHSIYHINTIALSALRCYWFPSTAAILSDCFIAFRLPSHDKLPAPLSLFSPYRHNIGDSFLDRDTLFLFMMRFLAYAYRSRPIDSVLCILPLPCRIGLVDFHRFDARHNTGFLSFIGPALTILSSSSRITTDFGQALPLRFAAGVTRFISSFSLDYTTWLISVYKNARYLRAASLRFYFHACHFALNFTAFYAPRFHAMT